MFKMHSSELAGLPTEPEELEAKVPAKLEGRTKKIVTCLGLAAVAGAASYLELTGKMSGWHWAARDVGQSLRHPLIGYAAAWWATRKPRKNRLLAVFAAASIADITIQGGEPVVLDPDHDPFEILSRASQFGTLRDYGATILGAIGHLLQNRQK